jgi:Raf kinase inhibitor-like YbhB/YbcL family protein
MSEPPRRLLPAPASGSGGTRWRFGPTRPGYGAAMPQKLNVANLKVTSSAFDDHERIPERHTGEGEDVSPALTWSGVPEGARSFALVVHDPDAPLVDGFNHWVLYNLPADTTTLPEGAEAGTSGKNSTGNTGYMGPAPPAGHGPHHYYFWVYALDDELDLPDGLDRRELIERIEDHVIEQARLVGIYEH